MRVTKQQQADNHQRILAAASALLRQNGIAGTGVNEVMQAAGLTHGGFYGHFASKDDLVAAACRRAFQDAGARVEAQNGRTSTERLRRYVAAYVSPTHRQNPATGCPIATLGADITRQSPAVRRAFTTEVEGLLAEIATWIDTPEPHRQQQAVGLLALLVGGMTMARAVDDNALADMILDAVQDHVAILTPTTD